MVTPINHAIVRAGFTLREALGTSKIFATNYCQIYVKTEKMSHHQSAGPLAGTVPYYGKSGPSFCITFIKRLDKGPR